MEVGSNRNLLMIVLTGTAQCAASVQIPAPAFVFAEFALTAYDR